MQNLTQAVCDSAGDKACGVVSFGAVTEQDDLVAGGQLLGNFGRFHLQRVEPVVVGGSDLVVPLAPRL
jgi:hypothetical protein